MATEKNITGIISTLDKQGSFSAIINNAEDIVVDNPTQNTVSVPYCTCNTLANNADKIVTTEDAFILRKGLLFIVKFYRSNTANNITLNINNTGSKSVYYHGVQVSSDTIKAGVYIFVYDNNVYELIGDLNNEEFQGVTEHQVGKSGLVPAPQSGDKNKFLRSDGTWATIDMTPKYIAWSTVTICIIYSAVISKKLNSYGISVAYNNGQIKNTVCGIGVNIYG